MRFSQKKHKNLGLQLRLIYTNSQDPEPPSRTSQAKYEGKLRNMTVVTSIICASVLSLVIMPGSVKAGFFARLLGRANAEDITLVVAERGLNSQTMNVLEAALSLDLEATDGADITTEDGALVTESGPLGTAADVEELPSSDEISLYVVRQGDTIAGIAKMFDVSANTILWANNLTKGQALKEGQMITILPISGVEHTIKKGDTIATIAKKYGGDAQEIAFFNGISVSDSLATGEKIIIPDGEIAEVAKPKTTAKYTINPVTKKKELIKGTNGPALSGYFIKPTNGVRTQGIHGHNGIDIGAKTGTPIYASAAGTVIVASSGSWSGGYGNNVVIKHPNGTQTLYAHMSRVATSVGSNVAQGEVIGYVGSTGKSTGPHLHFEVRGAKNPGSDNSWAK